MKLLQHRRVLVSKKNDVFGLVVDCRRYHFAHNYTLEIDHYTLI